MANTNDNESYPAVARPPEPDAHGQAALLLVESLIHGLIARSLISTAEAIEVVDVAADVKQEIAADLSDAPDTMRRSFSLLSAISASLGRDQADDEPPEEPARPEH